MTDWSVEVQGSNNDESNQNTHKRLKWTRFNQDWDMSRTYVDVTCAESGLESPPLSQMSSMEMKNQLKLTHDFFFNENLDQSWNSEVTQPQLKSGYHKSERIIYALHKSRTVIGVFSSVLVYGFSNPVALIIICQNQLPQIPLIIEYSPQFHYSVSKAARQLRPGQREATCVPTIKS